MNQKTTHRVRAALLAAALLSISPLSAADIITNWIAFNDHVPSTITATNANSFNLRGIPGTPPEPVAGFLKDFVTGEATPAYIITEATGVPDYFGTMANPNAGTPAYNLFNGIVDIGNVNSGIGLRSSANTTTTITISNLNSSQRYHFRGTAARGGGYLRRWTLASLRGADSFTDAHTPGVFTSANFPGGSMTNGQAAFDSGENREGDLVGWDNIAPGDDGVINIKCEQYLDNPLPNGQTPETTAYGYGFNAIYLVEVGEPTPVVITTEPPATLSVEQNRTVSLTVNAQGAPAPAYQWYKEGLGEIPGATARTFSIPAAQPEDSGNYYVVVTNSLNAVTSIVSAVTVFPDTTGPVLLGVRTDDSFRRIILTWDEPILPDPALEEGNYFLTDSLGSLITVNLATMNGTDVILDVPLLLAGTNYALEIDFQQDPVGNTTLPVGAPQGDPNGIVTNINTFVITPAFTRFQAFLNRPSAETLAQFAAGPPYPDADTFSFYTNVVFWPQSAPNLEQYVMRFSGYFVAPEDGLYKFNPSHDDDVRLRVHAGPEQSSSFTELSAACCTDLIAGPSVDVTLAAGQHYYYELLVREFGGGDNAGISVILPSGATNSPISAEYLAVAFDPAQIPNVGIAQHPTDQSVEQNHPATFSVVATNGGSAVSYQWQVDSGSGFVNVSGANGATYTTPIQPMENSGWQYRVLVTVPGRTITSEPATLTVVTDTHAPRIVAVRSGRNLDTITVFFDETMDPGAVGEPGNYDLTDASSAVLSLSGAIIAPDNMSVTFSTPLQILGARYTLHAQDIPDLAGNPLESTNFVFQTGGGFVLFEAYDTVDTPGNAVALLTAHPNFPINVRDRALLPSFDSRGAYADDTHEQYGARISGWFVAPSTTNYIFYNRSDDASELWLSTDNNPANKVKIQEELSCCNGFGLHPSLPQALMAGRAYYIELLYKEGTGGDFGQVAVKTVEDPADPNLLLPISGSFLSAVDPTEEGPSQPVLRFTREGDITTLSWDAPARLQFTTSLTPPDWKDVDTGGATTYVVNPSNHFDVVLDAAQAGGAGRTGSGSGTVILTEANTLIVDITYSGMSGTWANSHFHAPGARGINAGVAYGTGTIDSGNPGGTGGTVAGTITLANGQYGGKTIAQQLQDLRGSLWYLNIHSSTFGGGEIRGQVDPAGTRYYRLISP
jgi:hypothetical protein